MKNDELLDRVSKRVEELNEEALKLRDRYGVQGLIFRVIPQRALVGRVCFQVDRHNELWWVWCWQDGHEDHRKKVTESHIEAKVLFLETADVFLKDYEEYAQSVRERAKAALDKTTKLVEKQPS